jgi:hypothetical protein
LTSISPANDRKPGEPSVQPDGSYHLKPLVRAIVRWRQACAAKDGTAPQPSHVNH